MSNAKTIIIASNNAHKAEEIAHALDFPGWEFRTLKEAHIDSDPAEDADSFLGNARIKAKAAWEAAKEALGHPVAVLADDSGLEVDALDGAPGVFSSRYAGEHGDDAANNAKLLRELGETPDEERTARFVCTLVFLDENGDEIELKDDEDDFIPGMRDEMSYKSDDDEITGSGFTIEDVPVDEDDLGAFAADDGDDYTDDTDKEEE